MTTSTQESTANSGENEGALSIRQLVIGALILIAVTFGAGALNTISWATGNISILWPSTGLLIGIILYVPRRHWPAYLAMGFVVDFAINLAPPLHAPLAIAICASLCNIIEVLVAAWLLRPSLAPERYMARAGQLVSLLVYGVIVAPAVASLCYATGLSLTMHKSFTETFAEWFTGDALGITIVTPLYLALRSSAPFSQRKWYEALSLFLFLCAVSIGVFWQTSLPLLFLILPVLLLVEVRLGMAGAALGLLAISVIGGFFTARGHGPIGLTVYSLSPRTLMLQIFTFVSMLLLYIAEVVRAARNRFELGLRASEQRFRLLAEGSSDIITLSNLNREAQYVSPAATMLLGWAPGEWPWSPSESVHPQDRAAVDKLYADCLAGRARNIVEFRLKKQDGSWLWVETNLVLHRNPENGQPSGFVNVIRDISGRKAAEEELNKALDLAESLAVTDALTGIANRRRLDEYMDGEWSRAQRTGKVISILMIDVDHFKYFNDRYGHPAGDRCLREVADAISSVVQRSADFLARYGGEEFVVILPDTPAAGAQHLAEQIRAAVEARKIPHEGNPTGVVTVSIGCAVETPMPELHTAHLLLETADIAMYDAKSAGRNCVRIAPPTTITI